MNNKNLYSNYLAKLVKLLNEIDYKNINSFVKLIKKKSKNKKNIFVFGNGGSASTANHFAIDMTKNAKIQTQTFSNDNLITCFSNDYGFENWVQNCIKSYVKKDDLVIFISVSGNSKNLVNAVKYCKKNKIYSYSLTGAKKNNQLNKISDEYFWVNSKSYNHVEIIHHTIVLLVVDLIIGRDNYGTNL